MHLHECRGGSSAHPGTDSGSQALPGRQLDEQQTDVSHTQESAPCQALLSASYMQTDVPLAWLQVLYQDEALVQLLVSCQAHNYLEFKLVEGK